MTGFKARLSFFRSALATRRWSVFKYAWLLLGVYDLVLSQLIPKSLGDSFPKTVDALTTISNLITWQIWAGSGIAILVMASLEYSFRLARTANINSGIENKKADLEPVAAGGDFRIGVGEIIPEKSSSPTIAVVPFANMSIDAEQEYFADGISEDIINALTRFRWLLVIGRASSFTFKGKDSDPATIGRELGARYVLTGSVRKSANQIRVTAQLVDAQTRAQIWSSHFDGHLSEIFKVQDEITEKIIGAIEPALKVSEIRRSLTKSTSNLLAYDYFLRALSKAHLMDEKAQKEVETNLRRAIELDPTFSEAYSALVDCLGRLVVGGWVKGGGTRAEKGAPAIAAGQRAIELDPQNGAALATTSWAMASFGGSLDRAAELARQALVVQPNSPASLTSCGWTLIYDGDFDTALECLFKAHRLNPIDPEGFRTLNAIALAYIFKREFDTAESWSRRGVALSPLHPVGLRMLAIILAYQGRHQEAHSIGVTLRAEQGHYQFPDAMRHQWMRDLLIEGMRIACIPEDHQHSDTKIIQSSIAVLAFENISGDVQQDYIGDGIANDIIDSLSRIHSFKVIARNSSFRYRGSSSDMRQIAKELGVRYVVIGTVAKSADRLRISTQLVNGENGQNLWTEKYDQTFADLFDIRDRLTNSIAARLEPELRRAEYERKKSEAPNNLDAWNLYHRGMYLLDGANIPEEYEKAMRLFDQAIKRNDQFALAYAGRAVCQFLIAFRGVVSKEAFDDALGNAKHAVRLAPNDARCHHALAVGYLGIREFSSAIQESELTIQLNPSFAEAYHTLATALVHAGRHLEAAPYLDKAIELSPRDPGIDRFYARYSMVHLYSNRYEEAINWAQRSIRSQGSWPPRAFLISAFGHLGRTVEAEAAIKEFIEFQPQASIEYIRRQLPTASEESVNILLSGLKKAGLRGTSKIILNRAAQSSIAVLPFENLSGDPQQDFIGDGLASDIIANLSRIRIFMVIARNSTFQFKGKSPDLRRVANELGVRYLVVGTTARSAAQLRVSVQLVDGVNGQNLWSKNYDNLFEDLLDLQSKVTTAVVAQIEPELSRAEISRLRGRAQEQLGAWKNYYRGMECMQKLKPEDQARARGFFQDALRIDPLFARGHAGVGFTYWAEAFFGDGDASKYDFALAAGQRAVELDDNDPFCHFVLSHAYMAKRDFEAAIHEAEAALDLNPSYAEAYHAKAICLVHTGLAELAIPLIGKGISLSPRDLQLGRFQARLALANLCAQKHDEAVAAARQALLNRAGWPAHAYLASALAHLGKLDEASNAVAGLRQAQPDASIRYVAAQLPTTYEPYQKHLLDGLRKAGLREAS